MITKQVDQIFQTDFKKGFLQENVSCIPDQTTVQGKIKHLRHHSKLRLISCINKTFNNYFYVEIHMWPYM